jgi:hypothetical protein
MEIRFLGQFFLGQAGFFAEGTNVAPEIFPNFADFSHTADKQEARAMTIA